MLDTIAENQMRMKRETGERPAIVDRSTVIRAALEMVMSSGVDLSRCTSEDDLRAAVAAVVKRKR